MTETRTRRHVCLVTIPARDGTVVTHDGHESSIVAGADAAGIAVSMVAFTDHACTFAVDEYDLGGLRKALQPLDIVLNVRMRCARVSVSRHDADRSFPPADAVAAAMADAAIHVIHMTADADRLSVLVDERDAARALAAMVRFAVPTPGTR